MHKEFRDLEKLVGRVSEIYREVLVRDRSLWRNKDLDEVMATAELADSLQPGAAQGEPPAGLVKDEVSFYLHFLSLEKGRLEQEYLPQHKVGRELFSWRRAY